MNYPPSGEVTFLFTDIEGSTVLAQKYPDIIYSILSRHHEIVEQSIERNNGHIFKTVGDSFCVSFEVAKDAIKAALEIQKNLLDENWEGAPVKVRIGIHSGFAEWSGSHYMGYITLARTQRLMSVAYGQQILISDETYRLMEGKTQEVISFRDLGERRLKDLIQPMRMYQVISPELPQDFPQLNTLDARPNNLSIQLTSFVGREEEMKRIKDQLTQTHLLTLTGTGGAGKTRLALQVAADIIDDFDYGVWFIDLAALVDSSLLPAAICQALGIQELPKQDLEDTLSNYLKDKSILFVLDNCEHLIESCAMLTEKLLRSSSQLKIIATSREALRCSGELTHRVESLEIPDPKTKMSLEELTQYESVRLFIERALIVNPGFRVNESNASALAGICHQLDGIPLAIELAAARIKVLSIEKIHERLNNRFKLLTGGKRTALHRQQTLKALIDWSYDLLSDQEKILWKRLSVFSGGWTLEATEIICSDDQIDSDEILELLNCLNEKSIVIFDEKNERYRMLETIKQYGEEKLKETSEEEIISRNHFKFYMELAELAEEKLYENEMQAWMEKLDIENGNLEKALLWSLENQFLEDSIKLAGALGYFWKVRGHFSAGRRWLGSVLNSNTVKANAAKGKVLNFAGEFAHLQGEFEKGRKLIEESLTINKEIGNKTGIAFSLNILGNVSFFQGEYGKARELYEESLTICHEIQNEYYKASSFNNLGNVWFYQGDYVKAQELYEESLAIRRKIGDRRGIAVCLNNLGNVAFNQGEYERAWKLHEECLTMYRKIGDKLGIALSINNMGVVAFEQKEYKLALELHDESVAIYREIGDKSGIAFSLNSLGIAAFQQGDSNKAQSFLEESYAISSEIGNKYYMATSLNSLGNVAFQKGNYIEAEKFYQKSLSLNRELEHKKDIIVNILGLAGIQGITGYYKTAAKFIGIIREQLNSMGTVLEQNELNMHEETSLLLKEKLGEEEFTKCLLEGKVMTLEDAIELAL